MAKYPKRDRLSLDSQAFAAVLSAMFVAILMWVSAPVVGEPEAESAAIAAAPSQVQCARL